MSEVRIWFAWYPVRTTAGRWCWLRYVIAEKWDRLIPQGSYVDPFGDRRARGIAYQWRWVYRTEEGSS